jgi:hypothetical protein
MLASLPISVLLLLTRMVKIIQIAIKVNVKFTLEQATKAQRENTVVAPLFL